MRLCIPNDKALRLQILHDHHDAPIAGHLGIDKTYASIANLFFWPKMSQNIKSYIKSCDECQRNKPSSRAPSGLLQPLDIPIRNWEQVSMDFIVHLPVTKKGHDSIFVVVDRLSKRVHFIPTVTKVTAPEVAQLFFDHIFRHHGLPKVIVSDRDPKFISLFWKDLLKQLSTQAAMSTAHHPQTDGQTEQANRTLEDMLRAYVNYKQDNWDDCLAAAEFAYNNSVQASTGFSPFHLDCGQKPLTPGTLLSQPENPSQVATTEDFLTQWRTNIQRAKDTILAAQDRQAENANRHRRSETFQEGDKVMLSTAHLQPPSEKQRPLKKLQSKYIGPYTIQAVISPTAYRLQLSHTLCIYPVFHISLLRKYQKTIEEFQGRIQPIPLPVQVLDAQEPEYEVEAILD